jgi:hypothetical protein
MTLERNPRAAGVPADFSEKNFQKYRAHPGLFWFYSVSKAPWSLTPRGTPRTAWAPPSLCSHLGVPHRGGPACPGAGVLLSPAPSRLDFTLSIIVSTDTLILERGQPGNLHHAERPPSPLPCFLPILLSVGSGPPEPQVGRLLSFHSLSPTARHWPAFHPVPISRHCA